MPGALNCSLIKIQVFTIIVQSAGKSVALRTYMYLVYTRAVRYVMFIVAQRHNALHDFVKHDTLE